MSELRRTLDLHRRRPPHMGSIVERATCRVRPRAVGRCALAALAASLGVSSCAGDVQPVEPAPLIYTFSFGSDVQALRPYSMWLDDAREGVTNEIAVAVIADFERDCPVVRLQGTLTYDPAVLQAENHSEGAYMRQDGVDAQTSVTYQRGRITLRIDRAAAAEGVFGRGTVITIRFRAAGPSARGSASPLRWSDAHAYAANFMECLHATRDGEVSVR